MTNVLVTYIYPQAIDYIENFVESINLQTCNNFKLIVFNDGMLDASKHFKNSLFEYEIIPTKANNPASVRAASLEYLSANEKIKKIVFQDIDDFSSKNRMEVLLNALESYSLVCNDLTTFNITGIIEEHTWAQRLKETYHFQWNFIRNKNIVGLGNTGIRSSVLKQAIHHSNEVIAFDWFLFYQLMKLTNLTAAFTSQCQTLYRQHESNIAGVTSQVGKERLAHVFNVKKKHFTELVNFGFAELNTELETLESKKDQIKNVQNLLVTKPLFWWEETELL